MPKITTECFKCLKPVKGSLAKHLLTHIPSELWPYRCQFCGRYFQAKSDLPKHWKTSQHKDDPRIPEPDWSNPDWRDLLEKSQVYNICNRDEFDIETGLPTSAASAAPSVEEKKSSSRGRGRKRPAKSNEAKLPSYVARKSLPPPVEDHDDVIGSFVDVDVTETSLDELDILARSLLDNDIIDLPGEDTCTKSALSKTDCQDMGDILARSLVNSEIFDLDQPLGLNPSEQESTPLKQPSEKRPDQSTPLEKKKLKLDEHVDRSED